MSDTYAKLITLLDANKASYRLIDHAPEGQTDKVSALRGHPVEAAAKCIVLIVKIGKKTSRFVLAVVPGNARARRFYERCGWADGGLFDYAAAVSGGTMDVPCHRYVKPV